MMMHRDRSCNHVHWQIPEWMRGLVGKAVLDRSKWREKGEKMVRRQQDRVGEGIDGGSRVIWSGG